MKKIVIIGAGGHSRSVMDIILQQGQYEIAGCLDPSFEKRAFVEGMNEIPILGNDDLLKELKNRGIEYAFVALGDNMLRQKLTDKVRAYGLELINVISSKAYLSPRSKIGSGVCIMAGAAINVNADIGDGAIINTNASVDHDCRIGDFVHVAPGTAISGSTNVGTGTHIGTNSSVIDGIHIGSWSYIGAGTTVVADIPDHVMAYGAPAKIIRNI